MPKAKASKKSASPTGSRKKLDSSFLKITATGLPHVPPTYGLKAREKYLPFSHAEMRLAKSRNYWICTARPDGRHFGRFGFRDIVVDDRAQAAQLDYDVLTWFDPFDRVHDVGRAIHDVTAQVRWKDHDGKLAAPQILLRVDASVVRDQNIKSLFLGSSQ
jgi:hypothetical protein